MILAVLTDAPKEDICPLSSKSFSLSGVEAHHEAMHRAVSYLLAHYREPIALLDLLNLTGMSRATFARQFHLHTGKSFSNFLNQIRLQHVCRDLLTSTDLISNIAFKNGFNQLSFFNRLFQREIKKSPSQFRDLKQKASPQLAEKGG